MRYASMVFAAALSCVVGVFASAPAKAVVFDFSFISNLPSGTVGSGSATGTFTTGAASPTDPGFDLLTNLTFNLLSGVAPPPFSFTDLATSSFFSGAAFNPTTDAFINHFSGLTFDDFGGVTFSNHLEIDGRSFSQVSSFLSGRLPSGTHFTVVGPLKITPIPEPSTWAMMLIGFGGLGFLGYRQTRRAKPQAA